MSKKAYCLIRPGTAYRRERFHAGLEALGYEVVPVPPGGAINNDDLLIIWNRYDFNHALANNFEQAGAAVIVAENGYFQRPQYGGSHYALALGGHNGQGTWPTDDGSRWRALGMELQPWREDGKHVLVCPNRTFGRPGYAMPATWTRDVLETLKKITKREIRIRAHPGNNEPQKPLAEDLRDAWCTVVWYSTAGVQSLLAGVPVITCAPTWIAKAAAGTALPEVKHPPMPDRVPVFESLANAQVDFAEVESGYAFQRLLDLHARGA